MKYFLCLQSVYGGHLAPVTHCSLVPVERENYHTTLYYTTHDTVQSGARQKLPLVIILTVLITITRAFQFRWQARHYLMCFVVISSFNSICHPHSNYKVCLCHIKIGARQKYIFQVEYYSSTENKSIFLTWRDSLLYSIIAVNI